MAVALYVTWRRVMQNVIRPAEALGWSVVWVGAALVVLAPNITTRLAGVFGVGRGVDLILYASVPVLFMLVFKLFIQHEKMERKLTDFVRREALKGMEKHDERS